MERSEWQGGEVRLIVVQRPPRRFFSALPGIGFISGAFKILQVLSAKTHPYLELISLASNEIKERRVLEICRIAMSLPKLKRIELDGNLIPDRIVAALQSLCGDKLGDMDENDGEATGDASTTTVSETSTRGESSSTFETV